VAVVGAVAEHLQADFSLEADRFQHREVLAGLLRPWFAARTRQQVSEAFTGTHVLWAPFRHLTELAADLVAGAGSDVVSVREDAGLGSILATTGPIRIVGEPPTGPAAAPTLGEHTVRYLEPS
jgi:2-methylfumaryl-CoA isomerase